MTPDIKSNSQMSIKCISLFDWFLHEEYIHDFNNRDTEYFAYPSKKSGLFFTTIFAQFSSNAHPVLT